ncbi:MAG: galactokinase family protein, partial [Enterococcus aquimarinus]
MEKDLQAVFKEKYSEAATGEYFAPGRINLIGEHTDYNGGYVFPASITLGTYGLAKKRDDREIRLYSENFPEKGIITFSLDDLTYD